MKKLSGKQLLLYMEVAEIILFSGLAAYGIYGYGSLQEMLLATSVACVYFGWIIWELAHVTIGDLHREAVPVKSKASAISSIELAALAKVLILATTFGLTMSIHTALGSAGLLIMLGGVALRVLAINSLGSAYSHQIAAVPQSIVEKGPYRLIRHPAYLGTLIAHLGLVLVFCNPYSLASLGFWLVAVIQRTLSEEAYSIENSAYQAYASRVRYRLLPFIW